MGSPTTERGRLNNEGPLHQVTIERPFAVGKFAVTFEQWDTCVTYGGCPQGVSDGGWERGSNPVMNVTWDEAQGYVHWLAKITGKPYRLLSEAEYEYAARAGSQTSYPWGDDVGFNNANCNGCGGQWNGTQPAPVGSFAPNQFGLYDMVGNVTSWTEDCIHSSAYDGAPADGSAWIEGGECKGRIGRGGSWAHSANGLRSAARDAIGIDRRLTTYGFRVGRALLAP
jgi:formylglycine-generating enzyme required for sulfatase activity